MCFFFPGLLDVIEFIEIISSGIFQAPIDTGASAIFRASVSSIFEVLHN